MQYSDKALLTRRLWVAGKAAIQQHPPFWKDQGRKFAVRITGEGLAHTTASIGLLMTVAIYLRDRWHKELKYWRLRWWQLVLLLLWSMWPWICGWIFPRHPELWLLPQAPLLAFGYLGGGLFMAIFPGQPWAYPLGLSFTVFLLTYLVLVSWRWRRESKRHPPQLQIDDSQQNGSHP